MRQIHVEDDLRLRFKGRSEDFNEGVEIGLLVAAMAAGRREIPLRLAATTLAQAHPIALRMGYRIEIHGQDESWADITCRTGRARPTLRIVGSETAGRARAG